MDPRTGRPVQGLLSVAVLASTGTAGDALDNAFFVMGPERSQAYLKKLRGTEAFFFLPGAARGVKGRSLGAADAMRSHGVQPMRGSENSVAPARHGVILQRRAPGTMDAAIACAIGAAQPQAQTLDVVAAVADQVQPDAAGVASEPRNHHLASVEPQGRCSSVSRRRILSAKALGSAHPPQESRGCQGDVETRPREGAWTTWSRTQRRGAGHKLGGDRRAVIDDAPESASGADDGWQKASRLLASRQGSAASAGSILAGHPRRRGTPRRRRVPPFPPAGRIGISRFLAKRGPFATIHGRVSATPLRRAP